MTVSTFLQPNFSTQSAAVYKAAIDASVAVTAETAGQFAPHEQSTPDMTVRVDAGRLYNPSTQARTDVAAANTATITAPTTNPRKDIVYIDAASGTVGVATGVEAASPSDPAIPSGKVPIARVTLATGTSAIANSLIDDIRDLRGAGMVSVPAARTISTATNSGLSGGGDLSANRSLTVDGSALDALTAPAAADTLVIYDASATGTRKITPENFFKSINLLTATGTPTATADYVAVYDASATGAKKVLINDLGGGWTQIGTNEPTSDVSAITFTGLSGNGYRSLRFAGVVEMVGTARLDIQLRATSGTWRTIGSTPQTLTGGQVLSFDVTISNFDDAAATDIVFCSGIAAHVTNAMDRSSAAVEIGDTEKVVSGWAAYTDAYDEIRVVSSSQEIEGSTSDARGFVTLEAI